jgi:hypothetical protein
MKIGLVLLSCFYFAATYGQQGQPVTFISKKDSSKHRPVKLPLEAEIRTTLPISPFFLVIDANDSSITALSLLQNYDTNALKRKDYEDRVKQLDSLELKVRANDTLSKEEKERRITAGRMMLAYKDTVHIRVKDIKKIIYNRSDYSKREEVLAWSFTGASFVCAFAGLGELLTMGSGSVSNTIPLAVGIPLFTIGAAGTIISAIHLHRVYNNVINMRKWRILPKAE